MSVVRRRFRPGLWPTVVTLILFPLFIRLGVWQLDRAEQKHQIVHAFEQRMSLPDLDLNKQLLVDKNQDYRHVEVVGEYDKEHQLLLDNKVQNGRVGYQVLTPMRIAQSDNWILVNRGWVPLGLSRTQLPDVQLNQVNQSIEGLLKKPSAGEFTLEGGNIWGQAWPQVIQWLDISEVSQQLHHDFVPYVLLLSPQSGEGYVRDWHPVTVSPEQSESYAVQWFSFAAILLGLYLFLNIKKVPAGEA